MTREQLDAIRARFDSGLSLEYDETEALLAEVKRLTADPLPAAAWVREVERAAFKRGVAAMREAAVAELLDKAHYLSDDWADDLRALLGPEDTP